MAFIREVAERRGEKSSTEKRAFYRIIDGDVGDQSGIRIRCYAEILDQDPKLFYRPRERDESIALEAGFESAKRNIPDLQELEEKISSLGRRFSRLTGRVNHLVDRVEHLADRVEHLEPPDQSRKDQESDL